MPTVPPAILIFGYGNPSRGDDALGPLLLDELERRLSPAVRDAAGGIEFLTDFQLQIEHALDLVGRRLVLFADAHASCPPPYVLTVLQPAEEPGYSTHAISPATVLHCYREIHRAEPPPSFLLGIRGESFELGEDLSPAARNNLDAALERVLDLCAHPDVGYWRAAAV
jgi:hydrogenase maturation protease